MVNPMLSYLLVFLGGGSGVFALLRIVAPAVTRALSKRADRKVQLEAKRLSIEGQKAVAVIEAEAQRDVAEITGQHAMLNEANDFIRTLREERDEDRKRLRECEQRHREADQKIEDLRRQLTAWEVTESARELTFQEALKRAAECEREREKDRVRILALEQEFREFRLRAMR